MGGLYLTFLWNELTKTYSKPEHGKKDHQSLCQKMQIGIAYLPRTNVLI